MEKSRTPEERESIINKMAGHIADGITKMDIYEKLKYLERLHTRLDEPEGFIRSDKTI